MPAPPGVDMFAPPEVLRNAEGRKVKAALVEDDPVPQYNATNNTSIIEVGARKLRPGQRQLLLRHLDGNLKDLIRDTQRLTVALEYHESLPQGCPGSQRWVKLPRPKDQRRQMAL